MPPVCLDAPCMFGHSPYFWMPPVCLDIPHMFGCPCMFGCPLYVQMAPICMDTPHMFGCPCMFGCPLYVQMAPISLDTPHMFGCLLCIYNTKKACFVKLRECPYAPYTFRCTHMFGCSCMFGHPHIFGHYPYVWMSLKPLDAPYIWGYPWMPPVCLDTPIYLDTTHMFGCPSYLWIFLQKAGHVVIGKRP